jgi:putative oxidoreductase
MIKQFFAPGNDSTRTSVALLVLRVIVGLTMMANHGMLKLRGFSSMSSEFPDPLGVGHSGSLGLMIFAEVICSLLLVLGLVTRFAALTLAIAMTTAFFAVHKAALTGEHNGELAWIYLAAYLVLLIAGPGKLSVDAAVFGASKAEK